MCALHFLGSLLILECDNIVIQISVKNDMEEVTVSKKKPVKSGDFKAAHVC